VLLKGPTGCGKTRFIEYMAHRLHPAKSEHPHLITVACHEDLTGSDLRRPPDPGRAHRRDLLSRRGRRGP
jgi:MoxR-like ATPase